MTLEYRVGDVYSRLAEIPDGSIDLIVTSPPFLALRSYLPNDHPSKHLEIGSEATPADFLDTLLALTAEFGRVLAPHGSICVELGDTFSGSGGAGGDYNTDGLRDGAPKFDGSAARVRTVGGIEGTQRPTAGPIDRSGWPLAKSLTGIPTLYPWSLAYNRNLLTGSESPAGQWRIRNVIVWARPNPPVGALGDKFRPATSYITVACRGPKRYFDLDAVRTDFCRGGKEQEGMRRRGHPTTGDKGPNLDRGDLGAGNFLSPYTGAPPLDWHTDQHPEDGDWLWKLATAPYKGAHYATYPLELPTRLIMAMCPQKVCTVCGKPSERIVGEAEYVKPDGRPHRFNGDGFETEATGANRRKVTGADNGNMARVAPTLGWSDCDCACYSCRNGGCPQCNHKWRTGVVLDPFAGSGTTLQAAQNVGRHAIGIDLDSRNADLAQSRVGMFLEVTA